MNRFGQNLRLSLFGESHGSMIGVVIDGCPAGLPLEQKDFIEDMERRKAGMKGGTPRSESDIPSIKSGVFNRKTTGAPIALVFENKDIRPQDYLPLHNYARPGHADFVAHQKYGGFHDYRGGGTFSGRLTVALVAAGVISKRLIAPAVLHAKILEIGGESDFQHVLDQAIEEKDSLGGIIECAIKNLPAGLGEPFFDSVESLLSHIVFSIPGIKGIEFGSGFDTSRMRGSQCNDIILDEMGKTRTNHAGGINGGITNGNNVIFKAAVKPTPSIAREQEMIDLRSGTHVIKKIEGRHDACFALRLPVVLEAAAAFVVADLFLRAGTIPQVWEKDQ